MRWSAAYLVFLVLLWLTERWIGERHWLTMELTYLPQQWFALPLVALVPIAAARRDTRALALQMASVMVLLFPLLGVRLNLPQAGKPDIRVMTLNIEAEAGGAAGILRLIGDEKPDVVCLQEATRNIWVPDSPPTPALLAGLHTRYHVRRFGHLLIASRWPISDIRSVPLVGMPPQRPLVLTRAETPAGPLTLMTVHLLPIGWRADYTRRSYFSPADMAAAAEFRRSQVATILRVCSETRGPLILCGDFNMASRGPLFARLSRELADGFGRAGWGAGHTCPERWPLRRIDHVFARGLEPVGTHVPVTRVSDHRPMVVDLRWR